jgi:hypothetical protein
VCRAPIIDRFISKALLTSSTSQLQRFSTTNVAWAGVPGTAFAVRSAMAHELTARDM